MSAAQLSATVREARLLGNPMQSRHAKLLS